MSEDPGFSSEPPETWLIARLRELREERAPADLRANVLERLSLADRYFEFPTVAGAVLIAYGGRGVSFVDLADSVMDFEAAFTRRFGRPLFPIEDPPAVLLRQIRARLDGTRRRPPRVDLSRVTSFERDVLVKALEIPYGQVRPYSWIAREIGRPRAVRAVGSALAQNPIPLLIPCHRVVRSDGILGNYGLGGPVVKRRILEAEGASPDSIEALARSGVHYVGSDSTHIYCFPTCGHARRVTDGHRVGFASLLEARESGYRPCKVCRPAVQCESG